MKSFSGRGLLDDADSKPDLANPMAQSTRIAPVKPTASKGNPLQKSVMIKRGNSTLLDTGAMSLTPKV